MNFLPIAARLTLAMPFLLFMAGIALAQDVGNWSGHLILGGGAAPEYEGSEDYQLIPFAAGKVGYDDYYVETRGLGARANVLPGGLLPFGLEFGPVVNWHSGRDDVDNDRVDDLRDIDGTLEMGAFAKISTGNVMLEDDELAFEIEFLSDVGGEHDGTTISFGPSYSFSPVEKLHLGFDLSATYASGNYNDTYFSVDAANAARSGLSQYDADAGLKDIGVSVNATYQLTEHWGLTGIAKVTQLVGDAADSPIVDDEGSATQGVFLAGVLYSF
ncbi:MipA/OmpV family protein [Dongia sp.]|uniref:MipA/OmpV family protein n=1 Tax=Dongia sp. TaxID=1977262 RepID=UPI0035B31568